MILDVYRPYKRDKYSDNVEVLSLKHDIKKINWRIPLHKCCILINCLLFSSSYGQMGYKLWWGLFLHHFDGARDRHPSVFILPNQKFKEDQMFMYFPQRLVLELWVPNAAISDISALSWWSALLVKETGVPRENQQLVACHLQTLSLSCTMYIWQWTGFEFYCW